VPVGPDDPPPPQDAAQTQVAATHRDSAPFKRFGFLIDVMCCSKCREALEEAQF
jgi:hypothetical protein